MPGLFHLAGAGFMAGCRIVGVSLDRLDTDEFRKLSRAAVGLIAPHAWRLPFERAWRDPNRMGN
jgi:glucose-6-phosphate 1-dehydrogenase